MQGYLAHKKPPPPRTLPQAYAWGPTAALRGARFLISEVPLYRERPCQAKRHTRARSEMHSLVNSLRLITSLTEAHKSADGSPADASL